jgi:hypothetical protein
MQKVPAQNSSFLMPPAQQQRAARSDLALLAINARRESINRMSE